VREGAGSATFTLRYACLVFRPARGEVLDCVVASVSKVGFFADAGPMQARWEREVGWRPRLARPCFPTSLLPPLSH
jgi:DNA-directed RNA polymerase subunit E'/Rpb7